MKISRSELKEVILEVLQEEDSKYQEFFKKTLEKWGVNSPGELDKEEKKKFFDYIEKNWTGEEEGDGDVEEACGKDHKKKDEVLEPVSQAGALKRLRAKKRDQILAVEKIIRELVKEELKFVSFSEREPTKRHQQSKRKQILAKGSV